MKSNVISLEMYRQKRKIVSQGIISAPSAFFDLTEEEKLYFAHMFSDPELDLLALNVAEDIEHRILPKDEFPEHPFVDVFIGNGGEST